MFSTGYSKNSLSFGVKDFDQILYLEAGRENKITMKFR